MDRLLELLHAAVKHGTFTLSGGGSSDWYLDCREVTLTPEGSLLVAKRLFRELKLNPTACVGPISAACPLVTGIGLRAAAINWKQLKLGYIRKKPKEHGTGRLIEGCVLDSSDCVTIVDDVATSGGSLLRCIEAVQETGATVKECVVLVDREQGARERLSVPLRALYTRKDLC